MSCVSFLLFFPFLFFLIGNGPRASRSRSHILAVLVRSIFLSHNTLSRSCTRKKRRRRTAYGRGLYKINSSSSSSSSSSSNSSNSSSSNSGAKSAYYYRGKKSDHLIFFSLFFPLGARVKLA